MDTTVARLCNEYLQILLILCHAAPTPANFQKASDFIERVSEGKFAPEVFAVLADDFCWGGDGLASKNEHGYKK